MSIIAPTFYRSVLTESQKVAYRQITWALLNLEQSISLQPPIPANEVGTVVQAVHKDHPELFYVNFWSYYKSELRGLNVCVGLRFEYLLEAKAIPACEKTIRRRAMEILASCRDMPEGNWYRRIATAIASDVRYKHGDSENAFLYHSVAGAVLNHEAVCEGISKFFLFCCQLRGVPCLLVTGRVGDGGHAWNMVETKQGLRHVDVTSQLGFASKTGFCVPNLMKTDRQLEQLGYSWERIVPSAVLEKVV